METLYQKCLVYSDRSANSNKFYIAEVRENNGMFTLITKYGRLGKTPVVNEKPYGKNSYSCIRKFDSIVSEKEKKGYVITTIDDILVNGSDWFFN